MTGGRQDACPTKLACSQVGEFTEVSALPNCITSTQAASLTSRIDEPRLWTGLLTRPRSPRTGQELARSGRVRRPVPQPKVSALPKCTTSRQAASLTSRIVELELHYGVLASPSPTHRSTRNPVRKLVGRLFMARPPYAISSRPLVP